MFFTPKKRTTGKGKGPTITSTSSSSELVVKDPRLSNLLTSDKVKVNSYFLESIYRRRPINLYLNSSTREECSSSNNTCFNPSSYSNFTSLSKVKYIKSFIRFNRSTLLAIDSCCFTYLLPTVIYKQLRTSDNSACFTNLMFYILVFLSFKRTKAGFTTKRVLSSKVSDLDTTIKVLLRKTYIEYLYTEGTVLINILIN